MTSLMKASSSVHNASSSSYQQTENRKKRTRPVSACENCRSKKVKCHLLPDKPICKGCAQSGKECLFRVDDLSPALRRERFPEHEAAVNESQANLSANRRRRRKSSTAAEDENREDENGEDQDGKSRKANDGRPIKTKAIFRSFANPTKLAAPSTSKVSVVTNFTSGLDPTKNDEYGQYQNDPRRIGNNQNLNLPAQNGGFHPPPSPAVHQNGEVNGDWYSYPTAQGYEQQRPGPQNGQFRTNNYRANAQRLPAQQQQQPYLPAANILPQQRQSYQAQNAVPNSNISVYPSAYVDRNSVGVSTTLANRDAYSTPSALRDYVHRRSQGSPPGPELSDFRSQVSSTKGVEGTAQLPKSAVSPSPFAWSPSISHQTSLNANSPKRSSFWSGPKSAVSTTQPPNENAWQNEQKNTNHTVQLPIISSPHSRHHTSISSSSRDGLTDPSIPRNDLALASQLQRETDGEEEEKDGESEDVVEGGSSYQSSRRKPNVKLESHPSQSSNIDSEETPGSHSTSSRPPATFKKIALPFFRWFGATANTPGIRRIKIGVYHETDMDLVGVGEVEENKDDEQALGEEQKEENEVVESIEGQATSAITRANLSAFSPSTAIKPIANRSPAQASLTSTTHPSPNLVHVVDKAKASPYSQSQSQSHHPPQPNRADSALSTTVRELFETDRPRYPRRDILLHLVNLFIKYFKASCFPWIDEKELTANAKSGELPAILANSICAMTSRFSNHPDLKRVKNASESFADMAKVLVVPMLSWPSIDVIETLVILSYAEFGAGADAGLWMYIGMALRMATDLGLQHELTVRSMATAKQQERARYLFWSIVSLDRITCFGTGRPVTIRDDSYDCEVPALDNDPASDGFVFGHIVRTLLKRGQIGELLNRREDGLTLEQRGAQLRALWLDLAEYYESLPAELHFGVNTFRKLAAADKGCAFVYLHILLQSTISLLNRPSLLRRFDRDFSMTAPSRLASIANHAAGTIVSILRFACDAGEHRTRTQEENEEVNPYIDCNPYLDQLILPTGRAFLSESEETKENLRTLGHSASQSRPLTANGESSSTANPKSLRTTTEETPLENMNSNDVMIEGLKIRRQYAQINLATCQQVLDRVAKWWSGASWPARALRQEGEGAIEGDIGPDGTDEEAQPAPIRDVEMVLKWARARRNRAQNVPRMPSRRNSLFSVGGGGQGDGDALDSFGNFNNMGAEGQFDPSSEFPGWHNGSPLGLGFSGSLGADAEINMDSLINAWATELGSIESTAIQGGDSFMNANRGAIGSNSTGFVSNQPNQIGFTGRTGYTPAATPSAMTGIRGLGRSRPASRAHHRFASDSTNPNLQMQTGGSEYVQQIPSNQTSHQADQQSHHHHHHHQPAIDQDLTTWNYGIPGPMDMNLSAMQLEEFFFSPPAMIEGQSALPQSQLTNRSQPSHPHNGQMGDLPMNTMPYDAGSVNVMGQIQTPSSSHGLPQQPPQNHDNTGVVIQQNLDILPPALMNAFNFHPAPSPSVHHSAYHTRPNDDPNQQHDTLRK